MTFIDKSGKAIEEGIYYSDFPISRSLEEQFDRFFIYEVSVNGTDFFIYDIDGKEIPLNKGFASRFSRIENPDDLVSLLRKRINLIVFSGRKTYAPNGE